MNQNRKCVCVDTPVKEEACDPLGADDQQLWKFVLEVLRLLETEGLSTLREHVQKGS